MLLQAFLQEAHEPSVVSVHRHQNEGCTVHHSQKKPIQSMPHHSPFHPEWFGKSQPRDWNHYGTAKNHTTRCNSMDLNDGIASNRTGIEGPRTVACSCHSMHTHLEHSTCCKQPHRNHETLGSKKKHAHVGTLPWQPYTLEYPDTGAQILTGLTYLPTHRQRVVWNVVAVMVTTPSGSRGPSLYDSSGLASCARLKKRQPQERLQQEELWHLLYGNRRVVVKLIRWRRRTWCGQGPPRTAIRTEEDRPDKPKNQTIKNKDQLVVHLFGSIGWNRKLTMDRR